MNYPLAHDENGTPLEVPATATGWLVRRHAGGRGRPAAMYDGDGRPLVVPLDATSHDLRAHGCRPGTYRLDAVDSGRKGLGVAAYTEVTRDGFGGDDEVAASPATAADAAVAALARAVEAMQRVQAERERAQAERERVQAEMIARLVERLAPPAAPLPRNAREVIGEHAEVQEMLDQLRPEDGEAETAPSVGGMAAMGQIAGVVDKALDTANRYINARYPGADQGASSKGDDSGDDDGFEYDDDNDAAPASAIDAKVQEVLRRLTPAERRQALALTETMTAAMRTQVIERLLAVTTDEAVAQVRALLALQPSSTATQRAAS